MHESFDIFSYMHKVFLTSSGVISSEVAPSVAKKSVAVRQKPGHAKREAVPAKKNVLLPVGELTLRDKMNPEIMAAQPFDPYEGLEQFISLETSLGTYTGNGNNLPLPDSGNYSDGYHFDD